MKVVVKLPALLTILFLSVNMATAQLRMPGTGIGEDVKKVVSDYPSHFANITGDLIIQNPQSSDYQCNFKVSGAEQVTITRYSTSNEAVSSWQATMLTTESFDVAKRKFRQIYSQLNNLEMGTMRLKGVYETPAEEKKFTSVLFAFDPASESVKRLKVELVMEAEMLEWTVKLLVYDRDRDDKENAQAIE